MVLLDAKGQPLLAPTDVVVDQIRELVDEFDKDPSNWTKLEKSFDEQLDLAKGWAAPLVQVANGGMNIDMNDRQGAVIGRLLADIVVKALVLKARNDREEPAKVIPMNKTVSFVEDPPSDAKDLASGIVHGLIPEEPTDGT